MDNIIGSAQTVLLVSGSVVAPGLVDAHVHLMMDGRADPASTVDEGVGASVAGASGTAVAAGRPARTTRRATSNVVPLMRPRLRTYSISIYLKQPGL